MVSATSDEKWPNGFLIKTPGETHTAHSMPTIEYIFLIHKNARKHEKVKS